MLYYKSSRILTWYDQYLPPARGSQDEWESGGGGAVMLRTRWSNWPFETDVSNKQPTREKTNTILCYLAPAWPHGATHVSIHTFADTLSPVTAVVDTAGGLMSSKLTRPFGDVTLTINFSVWICDDCLCQPRQL